MTVNPSDIQGLPSEGESVGNAMMELLQDLAEGGGGGGITEITSTDMSVTITDPTGPTVDLSATGGSTPGVIYKTFTAAEIAARWFADDSGAAVEIPEVPANAIVFGYSELANDLDQNVSSNPLLAYDSGASTADVLQNGDQTTGNPLAFGGTYSTVYTLPAVSVIELVVIASGKAAYAAFTGDDAPTTGSLTVVILGAF